MRFKITLNMPSAKGNLVHQVLCDHASKSLAEFTELLEHQDFVTVTQYYSVPGSEPDTRALQVQGPIAIHRQVIGKIEELQDR